MPDKNPDAGPHNPAPDQLLRHTPRPGLKRWVWIAVVLALVIVAVGIGWRLWKSHNTAQWTDDQAVPTVQIIRMSNTRNGGALNLPGNVEAFTNAAIYAQVSGYLQKWYFDIGAKVKKNDLLAQIDPRTYQAALAQAKGALARDSATLANARVDLARYQALAAQNAISQQQLATQAATVNSVAGVVDVDRAMVSQAEINLAYTRIIAPFDGVVTTRSVDVGNLVTVGTQTSTTPLFTVSDQSRMRVYVRLPQNYASYVRPGMEVTYRVPQYPNRVFRATLAADAGAVASATGTVLIQFGTDNSDHALQPGAYANVRFPLPSGANGIRLPATALIFRDQGMQVATVDATNHVRLRNINILRDMGASVDVSGGVSPSDRIIDNPADALQEGDEVRIANR
ncbi:MAG TPA: efflux RND transporter periplasmic adaptor subunit [Rhizomicrobium sp.]|nr:efflux RND transporter periplasmic adaptor subunit [Rhizomicrobium sp.]